MSKEIYVLKERKVGTQEDQFKIAGVVSKFEVATSFLNNHSKDLLRGWARFIIDDPELLNRITKESNTNKRGIGSNDIQP